MIEDLIYDDTFFFNKYCNLMRVYYVCVLFLVLYVSFSTSESNIM